jgi:hypothetical protein
MKDLDRRIEDGLRAIEYPGEDPLWIRDYLEERQFVQAVMKAIAATHVRMSRSTIWAIVGAVNLAVLIVAGLNPYLVEDVLALKDQLYAFFYVALGLTLAGCIVGLVVSLAPRRLEQFIQQLFKHDSN